MLEIITDEKGILLKNGRTDRRRAINALDYTLNRDQTLTIFNLASRAAEHTGPVEEITLNGETLTLSNFDEKLKEVFFLDEDGGGGGLTPGQAAKLNLIITDGDGDKLLSDDGTYKEVVLKIDPSDKVLEQSTNGILANVSIQKIGTPDADFAAQYKLVGKDGTTALGVTIDILKDQLFKDVSFVHSATQADVDLAATRGSVIELGYTYICFEFELSTGDKWVYLDVSDLVDEYTAGNAGIDVADYKVSLVVDPSSHLEVNGNGLGIEDGYQLMSDTQVDKLEEVLTEIETENSTTVLLTGAGTTSSPLKAEMASNTFVTHPEFEELEERLYGESEIIGILPDNVWTNMVISGANVYNSVSNPTPLLGKYIKEMTTHVEFYNVETDPWVKFHYYGIQGDDKSTLRALGSYILSDEDLSYIATPNKLTIPIEAQLNPNEHIVFNVEVGSISGGGGIGIEAQFSTTTGALGTWKVLYSGGIYGYSEGAPFNYTILSGGDIPRIDEGLTSIPTTVTSIIESREQFLSATEFQALKDGGLVDPDITYYIPLQP